MGVASDLMRIGGVPTNESRYLYRLLKQGPVLFGNRVRWTGGPTIADMVARIGKEQFAKWHNKSGKESHGILRNTRGKVI